MLLVHVDGSVTVVDVKAASRLEDPLVVAQFAWTRRVCAERGWGARPGPGRIDGIGPAGLPTGGFMRCIPRCPSVRRPAACRIPEGTEMSEMPAVDAEGGRAIEIRY